MDALQPCTGLRLLLVGPYPPPYGGIASHLTMLIPGLISRGASHVSVISFGERDETIEENGNKIYYLRPRLHVRKMLSLKSWKIFVYVWFSLLGSRLKLKQLLEEAVKVFLINDIASQHNCQVVSFYQSNLSFALLPCSYLWRKQRGIVLTIFGELYDSPELLKNSKRFMKRLLNAPKSVASSSNHCACSFSKLLGISNPIQAVYYGIDLERFNAPVLRTSFREKLKVSEEDILLVFMGRFTREMGVEKLIEIAPLFFDRLPQVKLLLAGGKGPLANQAAELAASYPDRVTILHDVPFDLQSAIYAASDIVLAPSHDQHACMGMSIKEAMAAARPVIGSQAGGIPEAIVHEETGLLIPLDDKKHIDGNQLLKAIAQLVTNPAQRDSMGTAARRRAEMLFSKEGTINKMGKLFMNAIPE